MTKTYTLLGLDCPNCSNEIERELSQIKGIMTANINLIKQQLTIEHSENYDGTLLEDVARIVHRHEPDVIVEELPEQELNESSIHERFNKSCETGVCVKAEANYPKTQHRQNHHVKSGLHQPPMDNFFSIDNSKEKIFFLDGLDCAHCSAEIEKEAAKLDGVMGASVNLMKQLLTIQYAENYQGDINSDIEKIVHKFEPSVEVSEKSEHTNISSEPAVRKKSLKTILRSDKATIIRLIVGGIIYAAAFALSLFGFSNKNLLVPLFVICYVILGADVVYKAVKNILSGHIFDENFLMTVSTIGAFVIGEFPEASAVMLFYQIGEFFQGMAVKRSRKSVADLMDIRPDSANVKRSGKIMTVDPKSVAVGETVVTKAGEKIPLDGVVTSGEAMIDTTALTGESVPRRAVRGDTVLSGCINENGILEIRVTKKFEQSTASKIIDLVENAAGRKSPTENFITKFSRYYTPIVVGMAAVLAVVPPLLFGGEFSEWIHRCFVFLVISCPCALVISIPLTFFGGIGAASRKGILVKGSNYLEALDSLDTVVFDKTGTLTKGVFKVIEINTFNEYKKSEVLQYAAAAESMSNHPIGRSIVSEYAKKIDSSIVKNYNEISGQGISAEVSGHKVLIGNEKMMLNNKISYTQCSKAGTVVYISLDNKFAGSIVISDEIKKDSRQTIDDLKKMGIARTVMLTGDNKAAAQAAAEELNVSECFYELLPTQKVEKLEEIDSEKHADKKLAFVGDGINDAPVLARADIGIAMGALGSDAAIEAADIVLMTDEPSKIIDAIKVARFTKRIVIRNIVLVIAVKVLFLILGAFGIAGMWEAVFGDVGIMIIAVINSMRIIRMR